MPLTQGQLTFIHDILTFGDLIPNFTTDKEELKEEIKDFITAFNKPSSSSTAPSTQQENSTAPQKATKPSEFDQIWLKIRTYFLNPKIYFKHLQIAGVTPISVGDVQEAIINFYTSPIQEAAQKANLTLEDVKWNVKKLVGRKIPQEKYSDHFENNTLRELTPLPINSDPLPPQIYADEQYFANVPETRLYRVYFKLNLDGIYEICITAKYANHLVRKEEMEENFPYQFQSVEEREEFIDNFKEKIKIEAELECLQFVLRKLVDEKLITEDESKILLGSPGGKLLTDKFYLDNFKNKKISLEELLTIKEEDNNKLLDSTIMTFIEKNVRGLDKIKDIPTAALPALKQYAHLILQNKEIINDFFNLSDEQAKLLAHPVIINLVKRNRLTIQEGILLPACIKSILPLYSDCLIKHGVAWNKMYALTQADCELLKNQKIFNLINNQIVKITDLAFLKTLDLNLPMTDLYVAGFTHRFSNIFEKNSKEDPANLSNQIIDIAERCEISANDLENKIIKNFLLSIKNKIPSSDKSKLIEENKNDPTYDWKIIFFDLINEAQGKKNISYRLSTFSSAKRTKTGEQINDFFIKMSRLNIFSTQLKEQYQHRFF